MSLEELKTRFGLEWKAIDQAREAAEKCFADLRQLLNEGEAPLDSRDISIVVLGSLARCEWTSGSDLDWTFVIDGEADHEHSNTAHRFGEMLTTADYKPPGRTGIFGNLAFSHNLIHQIGGADDSNRNTTQRLLLLLESRALGKSGAYDRVILGILRRYLQNDFRSFRLKVPRFLLNDLHRFWRTMCVDYASKYRERAGEGWALRNIKLRMSRELIFTAGLVTCYSCDLRVVEQRDASLADSRNVEGLANYLRQFVAQTPLEIVCEALLRWASQETVELVLNSYDSFLSELDDEETRQDLEKLTPEQAEDDNVFQRLQEYTQSFQQGLERLFFDGSDVLQALNREYGVF